MQIDYTINQKIENNEYVIDFIFNVPQLRLDKILNFRINSIEYYSGSKKFDPIINDSFHVQNFLATDMGKNTKVHFYFNLNNLKDIKNITFGFCNEMVSWYRDTFITVDMDYSIMYELGKKEANFGNKICILSTWGIKCGISQYCKNFSDALIEKGYEVTVLDNHTEYNDVYNFIIRNNYNIFIVQYEPAIIKNISELQKCVVRLKNTNPEIKIYFTIHSERADLHSFDGRINGFLCHKPMTISFEKTKCYHIPMGVPIFNPAGDKDYYRNKYSIGKDKFVISTVGFMFGWKKHAAFLEAMVKYLNQYNDIMIQLLTSFHSINNKECLIEYEKIKNVIERNNLADKVIHITDYIPQEELSGRLYTSDMGFLWSGIETTSSSASLKEFVSSRLPLVKTNSNHHHDIVVGCVTTDKDINRFATKIIEMRLEKNSLTKLRLEMEECYNKINYGRTVYKFMEIFNAI